MGIIETFVAVALTPQVNKAPSKPQVAEVRQVEVPKSQTKPAATKAAVVDSGGNSGIAILEKIKKCESGGNYQAQNKSSTASGAYQFLDSTWANYGGYAKARLAPPSVQDRKAVETYNRSGTRPWNASKSCWSR